MRIAFFTSDGTDAAVARRLSALYQAGHSVTVFWFSRQRYSIDFSFEGKNYRLGTLSDRQHVRRIWRLLRAMSKVVASRRELRACSMVYAKNLDMALFALAAMWITGCRRPFTYEVLDILGPLVRGGIVGGLARLLERFVLRRSELLVVSSPGYIEGYFKRLQGFSGQWTLVENKLMPAQVVGAPRSDPAERTLAARPRAWKLGWFGTLRSLSSLRLLAEAAQILGGELEVELWGITNGIGHADFQKAVEGCPYMSYHGPYDDLHDLSKIYARIHIGWCGDLASQGLNGSLLLPNRVYQAGYFGVPLLFAKGTYAARYASTRFSGWVLPENSAGELCDFIRTLRVSDYNEKVVGILASPTDWYVGGKEADLIVPRQEPSGISSELG